MMQQFLRIRVPHFHVRLFQRIGDLYDNMVSAILFSALPDFVMPA